MSCCCQKNYVGGKNGGNGSAPPSAPPSQSVSYVNSCDGGVVVGGAPFLVNPSDFSNVQPLLSAPVIDRRGRVTPNNQYVFRSPSAGTVQVQSPKVGRY